MKISHCSLNGMLRFETKVCYLKDGNGHCLVVLVCVLNIKVNIKL